MPGVPNTDQFYMRKTVKNRRIKIFYDKIAEKHNLKLDVDQNYAR